MWAGAERYMPSTASFGKTDSQGKKRPPSGQGDVNQGNKIAEFKNSIESYWKEKGDDEARALYNRFINSKAQIEHLKILKAQSGVGGGEKLTAEQESDYNRILSKVQNESDQVKKSLEERLGDDQRGKEMLFKGADLGKFGVFTTMARELGVAGDSFEIPEWQGSHSKLVKDASGVMQQQLSKLDSQYTAQPASAPAQPAPLLSPTPSAQAAPVSGNVPAVVPTQLPMDNFKTSRNSVDPDVMQAAFQAEMQNQFRGARSALGQQLQTQADAQRMAFSQEMMPQLTGEAIMMGHFGSSRQGIAEGIARGRMESQLAAEQARAVAGLENNFAGMQNQWGLEQMAAANRLALQDQEGRQSLAALGFKGQVDAEVARQKGLVDMNIARLQGDMDLDLTRQKHLFSQEDAARQGEQNQTLSAQQAAQVLELEKWRQEQDLKTKQELLAREEEGQLRLKSLESERAMALEQLRGNQSMEHSMALERLRGNKSMEQAMALEELRGRQAQDQTQLKGQIDLEKAKKEAAYSILGDVAKLGSRLGQTSPGGLMADTIRKELGLPELPLIPAPNKPALPEMPTNLLSRKPDFYNTSSRYFQRNRPLRVG